MISTYFGKQGYTIYKECLELSDLKFIRDSLTVAPYIPKSPVQPEPFPVTKKAIVKSICLGISVMNILENLMKLEYHLEMIQTWFSMVNLDHIKSRSLMHSLKL